MRKRKILRKIRRTDQKCLFCQERILPDYKKPEILAKYVSDRGKIFDRVRGGICAKHQRKLSTEIKRARFLGLLPFVTQAK